MARPTQVAAFYADYEQHEGDRVRLFGAVAEWLPGAPRVLYAGSYVDIAASVWFDDVTYLDLDRRAARFFDQHEAVIDLVAELRRTAGALDRPRPRVSFLHQDYRTELPLAEDSVDLLVSLYAGFISEHCTRYLRPGGTLLANPSHGDAALASIDARYRLSGVVHSRDGGYSVSTDELDGYLVPKRAQAIDREALQRSGKGIGYTRPAFAYLFERIA